LPHFRRIYYTTIGLLYEHQQHFVNNISLCHAFPLIKKYSELSTGQYGSFLFSFQISVGTDKAEFLEIRP
jgi:hypothetical protein